VAAAHVLALQVCYEMLCYNDGSALSLASEKGGCYLKAHAKGIKTHVALTNAVVRDPFPLVKADPG
jgi:hypothetical protein